MICRAITINYSVNVIKIASFGNGANWKQNTISVFLSTFFFSNQFSVVSSNLAKKKAHSVGIETVVVLSH